MRNTSHLHPQKAEDWGAFPEGPNALTLQVPAPPPYSEKKGQVKTEAGNSRDTENFQLNLRVKVR